MVGGGRGVDVRVKRGSLSESRETRVPPPAMGRSLPCPSLIIADVKGSRQPSLDSFYSFTFQIINAFSPRIKGILKCTVDVVNVSSDWFLFVYIR